MYENKHCMLTNTLSKFKVNAEYDHDIQATREFEYQTIILGN